MRLIFLLVIFCCSRLQGAPLPENPPCGLVIFGGSGDLAKRKLFPALLQLEKRGELPLDFSVIGVGRGLEPGTFLEGARSFIKEEDGDAWEAFSPKVAYLAGAFEEDSTYERLKQILPDASTERDVLYYLSTPPSLFSLIVEKLDRHALLGAARVVVEKPFGRDFASAAALQEILSAVLEESQIYRMDHYLGMELLQHILPFRREHPELEGMWNQRWIDHISFFLTEDLGIGKRGAFWEQTGTLRDVVQNHVMQMISVVGMEIPSRFNAAEIQEGKIQFLAEIRPFATEEIEQFVQRGQYGEGIVAGERLPGYREEGDVVPDSPVETAVDATLWIDSKRWKGVPFKLQAGKRLPQKKTEIEIVFKKGSPVQRLAFQFYPKERITVTTGGKETTIYEQERSDPYASLLSALIRGDQSPFASYEETAASWRLWTPVLEYWEQHRPADFPNYSAGSHFAK